MKFSPCMRFFIWMLPAAALIAFGSGPDSGVLAGEKRFVGSQTCSSCHAEQYERFSKFARKAHSYDSVRIMEKNLTDAELRKCYECHTTGYGRPGGFVSEQETPQMKNNGCEVCHGPGSAHAESLDPADITGRVDLETCSRCHNSERVAAFKFKPMLYAGAH